MLLPRILSALVGIPIVMLCIYIGGLPFFFMFFAVILFSVMEFYSICKKYNPMNIIGILIAAIFYIRASKLSIKNRDLQGNEGKISNVCGA